MVLCEVGAGHERYTDLMRATGAPRDRLSARLRSVVAAGVLERRLVPGAPTRATYRLTAAGREVLLALAALAEWGHRWGRPADVRGVPDAPRGAMRSNGSPLSLLCRGVTE